MLLHTEQEKLSVEDSKLLIMVLKIIGNIFTFSSKSALLSQSCRMKKNLELEF